MDIFDVLKAISKRKIELISSGMEEQYAWKIAEFTISDEFHIPVNDIKRLYSSKNISRI